MVDLLLLGFVIYTKALANVPICFARNNLSGLTSNIISNVISKFDKKINGKGAVRAGKGITFFISDKDMNNIMKVIKPLEDLNVLIDGVGETVKYEIKKQGGGFPDTILAPLAVSLVEPMISSVIKGISGRGFRLAGKGNLHKYC